MNKKNPLESFGNFKEIDQLNLKMMWYNNNIPFQILTNYVLGVELKMAAGALKSVNLVENGEQSAMMGLMTRMRP